MLGESIETVLKQWSNPRVVKDIYGMSLIEASAVQNLMLKMPKQSVETLQAAACMFGMTKGPISNGGSN